MSIFKLALLVALLLAGTAFSVGSFLESRRPLELVPRVTSRGLPTAQDPLAPLAADRPAAAPRAEVSQASTVPASTVPATPAPAVAVPRTVSLERTGGARQGGSSRWTTVRRDGLGRGPGRSTRALRRIGSPEESSRPATVSWTPAPAAPEPAPAPTLTRPR